MKLKYLLLISMLVMVLTACGDTDDFYKYDKNMEFVNSNDVEGSIHLIFKNEDDVYLNYLLESSNNKLLLTLKQGEMYNIKYYASPRNLSNIVVELELIK